MLKDEFALSGAYFNSAYLGPSPLRAANAVADFARAALDPAKFGDPFGLDEDVRARFATLLDTTPNQVAISTSVSELVSHVANGLELHLTDEILLLQDDFPSMVVPWKVGADRHGFRVRFLPAETFLDPDLFRRELHDHTRLVACSHVMFNTGTLLPIVELAKAARANETLFLCDTSQSLGGMALPKGAVETIDILLGVAYKWLLGPYGSAYGHFLPTVLDEVQRTHASWIGMPGARNRENLLQYSIEPPAGARRFDRGQGASFLTNVSLKAALDLLIEADLEKIGAYNQTLVRQLRDSLPSHVSVLGDSQSNIICLKHPKAPELRDQLTAQDIHVSVREGALRISVHAFNTAEQIEKLARAL